MLEITDHGSIREVKLARKPANALNPELVSALTESLEEAARQSEAVVISGLNGMFCAGLDLIELLEKDRKEVFSFWKQFLNLVRTIALMPIPTAFAMTGHAPAGGIVMALYGDYRIMPEGKFKTGLNEVQVGLVVPVVMFKALVRAVGPTTAERLLVAGNMITSNEALEIGLIDELATDPQDAVANAIAWCENKLALPRQAMLATRSMVRADLHALFDASNDLGVEQFVEIWFSEESRATLLAVVDRLRGK